MVLTRGVVFVHSAPAAICPHAEWAISGVLGTRVSLNWTEQPALPGTLRADVCWTGEPGTGGRIAAALRTWTMLRFEVTEEASPRSDGERICYLPGRGAWRTLVSANGDVMLGEDRIRAIIAKAKNLTELNDELNRALGAEFDAELEPYRRAGEGTPVTWLHQVG